MILAIVNQKGGVGKTTTAVTLADGLARRGHETLLVDLDAQGNCADALGDEKRSGLYELLIGRGVPDAITFAVRPHLDAVYSDKRTAEAKQVLAGMSFREQRLKRALAETHGAYEFIILDVAPGIDVLQVSALVACTEFLIPVALDHLAVVGAADALASAMALEEAGADHGRFLGVLPTMWERTTKESHAQLQALAGQFKKYVWPPIPVDVKAREAPAHGETLWEYAPGTRALAGVDMRGNGKVGGYAAVLERLLYS
jgi:chromosome partitioning protein